MFLSVDNQNHLEEARGARQGAAWERWLGASGAALLLVVPPIVRELYPFSLPSMFWRRIARLAVYEVRDPRGAPVSLEKVHLHVAGWHDRPVGFGRGEPASVHAPGAVASAEEIEGAVRWSLRGEGSLPAAVTVGQRAVGRGPEGGLLALSDPRGTIGR